MDKLHGVQAEAKVAKSLLTSVAQLLGDYIATQKELFSRLFLKIDATRTEILRAKRVLDLLFHADKALLSETICKKVKQSLNSTYTILCSDRYHKHYFDMLQDYKAIEHMNQVGKISDFCVETTLKYIDKQAAKLRKTHGKAS